MTADQIKIRHWADDDPIFEKKYNAYAGRGS